MVHLQIDNDRIIANTFNTLQAYFFILLSYQQQLKRRH